MPLMMNLILKYHFKEGVVGYLLVFHTREDAEKYVDDYCHEMPEIKEVNYK